MSHAGPVFLHVTQRGENRKAVLGSGVLIFSRRMGKAVICLDVSMGQKTSFLCDLV